jgi:hypothetical protein
VAESLEAYVHEGHRAVSEDWLWNSWLKAHLQHMAQDTDAGLCAALYERGIIEPLHHWLQQPQRDAVDAENFLDAVLSLRIQLLPETARLLKDQIATWCTREASQPTPLVGNLMLCAMQSLFADPQWQQEGFVPSATVLELAKIIGQLLDHGWKVAGPLPNRSAFVRHRLGLIGSALRDTPLADETETVRQLENLVLGAPQVPMTFPAIAVLSPALTQLCLFLASCESQHAPHDLVPLWMHTLNPNFNLQMCWAPRVRNALQMVQNLPAFTVPEPSALQGLGLEQMQQAQTVPFSALLAPDVPLELTMAALLSQDLPPEIQRPLASWWSGCSVWSSLHNLNAWSARVTHFCCPQEGYPLPPCEGMELRVRLQALRWALPSIGQGWGYLLATDGRMTRLSADEIMGLFSLFQEADWRALEHDVIAMAEMAVTLCPLALESLTSRMRLLNPELAFWILLVEAPWANPAYVGLNPFMPSEWAQLSHDVSPALAAQHPELAPLRRWRRAVLEADLSVALRIEEHVPIDPHGRILFPLQLLESMAAMAVWQPISAWRAVPDLPQLLTALQPSGPDHWERIPGTQNAQIIPRPVRQRMPGLLTQRALYDAPFARLLHQALSHVPVLRTSPWLVLQSQALQSPAVAAVLAPPAAAASPVVLGLPAPQASAPLWLRDVLARMLNQESPLAMDWEQAGQLVSLLPFSLAIRPCEHADVRVDWSNLSAEQQWAQAQQSWLDRCPEQLKQPLQESFGRFTAMMQNAEHPRPASKAAEFKVTWTGRLEALARSGLLDFPEQAEKAISALVGALPDVGPGTCTAGWDACLEAAARVGSSAKDLGTHLRKQLGMRLYEAAVGHFGRLLGTPQDAHLKTAVQMACHLVDLGTSVGGMSESVLDAAWNDKNSLQDFPSHPWENRARNLHFPEALTHVREGKIPFDRRVIHLFRQELNRALSPLEALDILAEALDSVPLSAEEGFTLGNVEQMIFSWAELDDSDPEIYKKLKELLLSLRSQPSRQADRRLLALIVGGAEQILAIAGDRQQPAAAAAAASVLPMADVSPEDLIDQMFAD